MAHDQAHETTRLAQEKADRCVAEAEAHAEALTEEAKRRLNEIDGETDAVWRERARLLEDARYGRAGADRAGRGSGGALPRGLKDGRGLDV